MNRPLLLKIVLFLLVAAGGSWVFLHRDALQPQALEQWLQQFGILAPVVFILLYAAGTVLFLPGSIMTLLGGVLFGPWLGTFYNLTAATLGATLAFLIARYIASDWVASKSAGRLKQIMDGVEAEGWKFVAFVRLVPLFPFFILNYALGLTRIRLWHYVAATFICMLPGGAAYTYLGYAGREAVAGGEGLMQKGIIAIALLALAAFLPSFIRRFKATPSGE
ncbi:MAG: TVP38/TMEM64 family protein [Magnetococcales bacterium]|nr:TVP38/TMEM64 family protein [Magnetococcales bacterium]NGZ27932.1 TVP38/TMEM64 family protein [Magnetococcales bacterium]